MNQLEPPVQASLDTSFKIEDAAALLAAIVTSSSDAILSKTLDGTITSWNLATEQLFGYKAAEMIGQSIRRLIPEDRQGEEDRILARISAGERIENYETVRVCKDSKLIDVAVTVSPVRNQSGIVIGASKIIRDISERKRSEEQIQFLLREVNHRSKNMLSLVQAIARQTVFSSPADFLSRFLDRLQGLAANQDLLIENEWHGIYVDDLVRVQFDLFRDLIGRRIDARGPRLLLTPKAAQTIGMAVHELITNATKYGAFLQEKGRVNVVWYQEGEEFSIRWTESEGPAVTPPLRPGYGSKIITAIAEAILGGEARIEYHSHGVIWHLKCLACNALAANRVAGQEPEA